MENKKRRKKGNRFVTKNLIKDSNRNALRPGKRISKKGNVYYEYRSNHSDLPNENKTFKELSRKDISKEEFKKLLNEIKKKYEDLNVNSFPNKKAKKSKTTKKSTTKKSNSTAKKSTAKKSTAKKSTTKKSKTAKKSKTKSQKKNSKKD